MNPFEARLEIISDDLASDMETAGTFDELKKCWTELSQDLGSDQQDEFGTLRGCLRLAARCFLKGENPACDSAVKAIFDSERLLGELQRMEIPQQFLLQSVRVAALKGYLTQCEKQPGKPLGLFYDLETDIDGFMWANKRLEDLARTKEENEIVLKRLDAEFLETRKEALLVKLGSKDEKITLDDADLYKKLFNDVEFALKRLRGLLQSSSEFDNFLFENGDKEITKETYDQIVALPCVQKEVEKSKKQGHHFPVRLLNPQSPWFYFMKKNDVKTLGELRDNLNCNMNDWFDL